MILRIHIGFTFRKALFTRLDVLLDRRRRAIEPANYNYFINILKKNVIAILLKPQ